MNWWEYEKSNSFMENGHRGIDFKTPLKTAVSAIIQGVVYFAGFKKRPDGSPSYGNLVIVKDNNNNYHYFAHLDSINVKEGQAINIGDLLGYSGNTGNSTGPHLHYEVRENNNYDLQIDPMKYVNNIGSNGNKVVHNQSAIDVIENPIPEQRNNDTKYISLGNAEKEQRENNAIQTKDFSLNPLGYIWDSITGSLSFIRKFFMYIALGLIIFFVVKLNMKEG